MLVLIDGHNLIVQLPDISLADADDEARLVSRLQGYAGRTKKRVTVVFDRGLPGGRSEALSGGRVEVIFAPTGGSADGVLIGRIRRARNPRGLTVVTSDRAVIAVARRRGARVVPAEVFIDELEPAPVSPGSTREDVHLSADEVDAWLELFEGDGS
jgi:hypothetical protein